MLGDDAQQVLRVPFAARAQDDEPPAGHEREEDLVDGDVEGERRLEQRGVVGSEAQDLGGLPQQAFADGLVADHRALGAAGGARGEDDVREGGAGDGDRRGVAGEGAEAPVAEVDADGLRFAGVVRAGGVQLEDDPRVLDDDGAAGGGPLRVERDESGACLEDAEQPDHHVGGAAEGDADDLLGGDSAVDEVVGQLGGELDGLTVGQ